MNSKILLIGFAVALVTIGCGMGSEDPPIPKTDIGPSTTDNGTTPTKMQAPSVDPIPNTICSDSVPLQGAAVPGASVFVMGGLATSGIATDAHPTTGRFCIDVPLKKGSVNTIEVRAQDPVLGVSEPTTVSVTHGGTCQDDVTPPPDPPKSKNIALNLPVRTSKSEDKGNPGFLTDGNSSTVAVYSGGSWTSDANIWLTMKLEKLMAVEKIVVRWRDNSSSSEHQYAVKYKVLISTKSDPGDPNLDNGYWTPVAEVTSGDGGVDTFDLKTTKPQAQHVAVWLQQDGASYTWSETFAVAEIEVWDVPKTVTPIPTTQTNTCANIGAK